MIQRSWDLRVTRKEEILRDMCFLSVEHEYRIDEPYWLRRTHEGAPVQIKVTKEEFDAIEIGDVLRIDLTQVRNA